MPTPYFINPKKIKRMAGMISPVNVGTNTSVLLAGSDAVISIAASAVFCITSGSVTSLLSIMVYKSYANIKNLYDCRQNTNYFHSLDKLL